MEVKRHTLLSDKMGFHFFELPKLPDHVDEDDMLLLWLSLFKALYNTERNAKIEIARKALKKNIPVDDISDITGLSCEEIKDLYIKS